MAREQARVSKSLKLNKLYTINYEINQPDISNNTKLSVSSMLQRTYSEILKFYLMLRLIRVFEFKRYDLLKTQFIYI